MSLRFPGFFNSFSRGGCRKPVSCIRYFNPVNHMFSQRFALLRLWESDNAHFT